MGALGPLLGRLGALLGRILGRLGGILARTSKNVQVDPFFGTILEYEMEAKITLNRIKLHLFSIRFSNAFLDRFFIFCWKVRTSKISISLLQETDFYQIDIF